MTLITIFIITSDVLPTYLIENKSYVANYNVIQKYCNIITKTNLICCHFQGYLKYQRAEYITSSKISTQKRKNNEHLYY